ncbi:hypothetical protein [Streptomyces sp. NPDC101455]|uniref:hypothetical protein n=1 Tax=Streptomyces sp. NPDC101455 TaxID=3366142 RepID=UPI0038139C14
MPTRPGDPSGGKQRIENRLLRGNTHVSGSDRTAPSSAICVPRAAEELAVAVAREHPDGCRARP